ncbi:MAG: T9SS type A sorting domain-containing protein [Bacteroidota bacterium]
MFRKLHATYFLAIGLSLFFLTTFSLNTLQASQLLDEPPMFFIEGQTICEGDRIEVPVKVRFFEDMTSAQFTIGWNKDILQVDSVSQVHPGVANLLFGNITSDNDHFTMSWLDQNLAGVDIPDDASLFVVYFTAIGSNGETSDVEFRSGPVPFEITQNTELIEGTTNNNAVAISEPILMDAVVENETDQMSNGKVDITISSGTEPYAFSWSNGANSEDLTDVAAGSYTCMITDANSCALSVGPYVVDNLVNANEIESLIDIRIFPNPARDVLGIQATFDRLEKLTIRLYDVLGKVQYEEHLQRIDVNRQIEVAHLSPGQYFLEISADEGRFVENIILQD